MKKITAISLLAAMLATISCGTQTSTGDSETTLADTTSTAAQETEAELGREAAKSALPDSLSFDGETVTVLVGEDEGSLLEIYAEQTGDVVDDAVYSRNVAVEERLGITIAHEAIAVGSGDKIAQAVKTQVLAGDSTYDVAFGGQYYSTALALEGVFYNLLNLPHLDLGAPWYSQIFIDAATLYDTLFYLTGDISLSSTTSSYITFYNKKLAESHLSGVDLYGMVNDGKWTLEGFDKLLTDIYQDLNGNGQRDDADFYGYALALGTRPLDALLPACDISLVTLNKDGDPELSLNSERTIRMYELSEKLFFNNTGTFAVDGTAELLNKMAQKFRDSQSLFYVERLSWAGDLRDFTDPYGILPIPKFDEAQENYYTIPHDQYRIVMVPSNCERTELVGAFIEEMSVQSYKTVTPAYFETALKTKYLNDNVDAQMYDLIIEGKRFDPGVIFSTSTGNLAWVSRVVLKDGEPFTSYYASIEDSAKEMLANVAKTLKELSESLN